MPIGAQIRRYRKVLNWKLAQLSEASGVDVGTLSALELRDSVRSAAFLPISQALGLTLEQLADESQLYEPKPPSLQAPTAAVNAEDAARRERLDLATSLTAQLNNEKLAEVISYLRWQVASQEALPK